MKPLPSHVIKVSEKWYRNTQKDKYIHADKINDWLENYWSFRSVISSGVNAKKKYNKNIKAAKKRWGL